MSAAADTPRRWEAFKGHPVKQSNFGRYKTLVSTGTGNNLCTVGITADTPELAQEVARNAAAASELLEAAQSLLNNQDFFHLVVNGHTLDSATKIEMQQSLLKALPEIYDKHQAAIAKAEGSAA